MLQFLHAATILTLKGHPTKCPSFFCAGVKRFETPLIGHRGIDGSYNSGTGWRFTFRYLTQLQRAKYFTQNLTVNTVAIHSKSHRARSQDYSKLRRLNMFWSAALDLKTQRLPCRSYGSFSRSDVISNSFHIPQSIPEHQPVSQFTSPLPDRRRIEEYVEHPDTVLARARQVTEHTQTALKLLLQASAQTAPKQNIALEMHSFSKTGTFATLAREVELAECTALLKPLHSREVLTTQESRTEQNYWMQELERRRAGLQKSRRRTCTPMSERATTSPLKVGVVMCSVPLVLVIAFVLYMFIFGDASSDVINVVYQPMSIGEFSIRHTTAGLNGLRIVRAIAQEHGELHVDKKDFVTASDVLTSLRSPQKEETDER